MNEVKKIQISSDCDCDELAKIGSLLHEVMFQIESMNNMIENIYNILDRHESGLG
jgi:hypothetical protein